MMRRPVEEPSPAPNAPVADFYDAESQRVLSEAARALAGALGRQAAQAWFAQQTDTEAPR